MSQWIFVKVVFAAIVTGNLLFQKLQTQFFFP